MKDAYYFSHDGNARNDPKMLMLRAEFTDLGYARYFMILEMMREAHNYRLPLPYLCQSVAISLAIKTEEAGGFIDRCIELGLFAKDDNYLYSESFLRRMAVKENLSQIRRENGKLGAMAKWQNDGKLDGKLDGKTMAVKERKGKERKEHTTTASATADGSKPVNWDNCRNDLQRLIAHYIKAEMPELYKTGTQAQATALFKRYGRPASELLGVSGDLPTAKRAFDLAMAYFRKKGLSWNLNTVTVNSAEFVNAALQERSKV